MPFLHLRAHTPHHASAAQESYLFHIAPALDIDLLHFSHSGGCAVVSQQYLSFLVLDDQSSRASFYIFILAFGHPPL